jgi:hypothetical protein
LHGNPDKAVERLRWEDMEIFSQSQLRTYLVKSHNSTFRGACELENTAIEQSFVAVCGERRP